MICLINGICKILLYDFPRMVLCLLMQHHFLFCFREVRKLFYAIQHFFTMIGALLLSGILFLIGYTVLQKAKENKNCSRGFSRAARPKFEAFHGLPGR